MHFPRLLCVVVAVAWSVGCGSFWAPEEVWTADGMYLVSGRSGALFLTPPPPAWNRYRGVVLDEIRIGTKHRSRDLEPFEEERLRDYLARRLEHAFRRNGWPVVDTPAEDVLRARVSVKGLELPRWRHSHFGKIVQNESSDRITIVLELRDAATQDRRLLFGDRRTLPFGVYSGSDSVSIRRVEDAFYDFSIDVGRRLDQVQRGEFPPPPRPS